MINKDSAVGRFLRVWGYQLIVLLIAILTDPEAMSVITKHFPRETAILLAGAPIITLLYNLYRKDVRNV